MNRNRGIGTGLFVLAILLTGCSDDKTLNVEGAYTPVIVNIGSDHEPPVRGAVNTLTVVVQNPRGYPLTYHWSTAAGVLSESTTATVHWTPPDTVGTYAVTVSIQAHDDLNNVDFFKTRTFPMRVENEYQRWTRSTATQFDVTAPVAGGVLYFAQIRNSTTGQSDIWSLSSPLGTPTQVTRDFWQAVQPTAQSDGSRVAFMGKRRDSDVGASMWQVPPTGGDTTTAAVLVEYRNSPGNHWMGGPRFHPTTSFVAYGSDSTGENAFNPKPWMRDAGNMAVAPILITPTTITSVAERQNSFWNPAWRGSGDSIVTESYEGFGGEPGPTTRGLVKFSTVFPPNNPEPFPIWLNDPLAKEPDWSSDGQYIVFSKRVPGRSDRDLWIMNAASSDPASARPVTTGPADDSHPRFSSDGSSIFFVSDRADGYGSNGVYETERRGVNVWSVSRFDRP